MDLKNTFRIKDATTKNISVADIRNNSDMEYSYFTKAHQRSMNQVVREFYLHIYEIVCLCNYE